MARKPVTQPNPDGSQVKLAVPAGKPRKRLIIFIHGIRDPGYWQQDLKKLFEAEGFIAVPIGYGVFDIARFILGIRKRAIEDVKLKIKSIIDSHTDEATRAVPEVTILAHSFGTYIVSQVLDEDTTIDIKRLVMCGGIVSQNFRWDKLVRLNGQFGERVQIINEHSARDVWPLMASHITLGFGPSGTIGCQNDDNVQERGHNLYHGGYLNRAFAEKFWMPTIARNEPLVPSDAVASVPLLNSMLMRSPVTILQVAAFCFLGAWAYWLYDKISYRTQGMLSYDTTDAGLVFSVQGRRGRDEDWQPLFSARSISSTPEHRLLSMSRPNNLRVEISNRQPINCNPDSLEDEILERSSNVKTTYIFDLSRAHRWFGKTDISFSYFGDVLQDGTKKLDRLDVSASGGLDQNAIRLLSVKHEGDKCLDENHPFDPKDPLKSPFVRFAQDEGDAPQLATLVGPSEAFAADKAPLNRKQIYRSLKSQNPNVIDESIDVLATAPADAEPGLDSAINELIRSKEISNEALAKLLTAARDQQGSGLKFDPAIIVTLSYHDDVKVRDAARSYARSPASVGPAMIQAFEEVIARDIEDLRQIQVEGKDYGKDYLLLIAARDVYYNYGIKRLEQHLSQLEGGVGANFSEVEAVFKNGQELRKHAADPRQMVSLAKNTYGLALSQLRNSALSQAIKVTGGKDSTGFILKARAGNEPIEDTASKQTFTQFLQETNAFEKLYPWQNHIAVANRCLKALTYACYVETAAAE
jgi:hypothetical protein